MVLKGKLENLASRLTKASGYAFCNTARYGFEKLLPDAFNLGSSKKKDSKARARGEAMSRAEHEKILAMLHSLPGTMLIDQPFFEQGSTLIYRNLTVKRLYQMH